MKHPTTINASKVSQGCVTWLIDGLIPKDRVTIIDGDPGQGKSFLTLELAAALSVGQTLTPRGRNQRTHAIRSLILNAEDDLSCTILPRLVGLGADLQMIDFCPGLPQKDHPSEPLLLPRDWKFLDTIVRDLGSELLVIDPIMAYLEPSVKTQSDQAVRLALRCLKEIAEMRKCTVVLVRHLNKSGGQKALYRGGGSIGIIGLARAAFYVGPNPEEDTEKLFAQVKNNLGPLAKPWRFTLSLGPQNTRVIRWGGIADIPMSRLLHTQEAALPIETAQAFLKKALGRGKSVSVMEITLDAKSQGIHFATLMRAKKALGVRSRKVADRWYWSLPSGKAERDAVEQLKEGLFK